VHGLFTREQQRAVWLRRLEVEPSSLRYEAQIDETLDALAEHIADHVDLDQLLELAR
jgi:adenosylcobyric acid synthase